MPTAGSVSDRFRRLEALAVLAVFFLSADLLMPMTRYGDLEFPVFVVLVGVCIAQVTLIGVWAAWGPGSLLVRLPRSLLLVVWMWYALLLGNHIGFAVVNDPLLADVHMERLDQREALTMGMMLGIAIGALQIPLWIARWLFGWKLAWAGDSSESYRHQFQLWHVLIGTVILAVLLAVGRQLVPREGGYGLIWEGEPWILFTGFLFGAAPLVAAPMLVMALPVFKHRRRLVAGCLLLCCCVVSFLQLAAFRVAFGPFRNPSAEELFVVVILINGVEVASAFFCLNILRRAGLRLVRVPLTRVPTAGLEAGGECHADKA